MKVFAVLCLITTVILTLTPLTAVNKKDINPPKQEETTEKHTTEETSTTEKVTEETKPPEEIEVLAVASGNVVTMNFLDYIIGVVAGEMPASYHEEALKAQAVAAYTYALRNIYNERENPSPALKGASITDDSTKHQAYITVDKMKEKWGDNFDTNYKKIANAVKEVFGEVVTYNGQIANTLFHSISSGKTESAKNIWGGSGVPYLVSVDSTGDVLAPNYSSVTVLSKEQFKNIAKTIPSVKLSDNPKEWVGEAEKTTAGTVTSITIGGVKLKGTEVRAYFGLRSPAFTITYKDGNFTIKTTGYGHGVGMSQYGADYMARKGKTYREILAHYYPGTEIVRFD